MASDCADALDWMGYLVFWVPVGLVAGVNNGSIIMMESAGGRDSAAFARWAFSRLCKASMECDGTQFNSLFTYITAWESDQTRWMVPVQLS